MKWTVVTEPKGENPGLVTKALARAGAPPKGENISGLVIYLSNGSVKQEVSRVAYIRRPETCRNPNVPYADQLRIELAKARETCNVLNEKATEAETPS